LTHDVVLRNSPLLCPYKKIGLPVECYFMSNGSSSSRLPFTIATSIAGAVFGIALGLFLAYVVLPANLVLRDAPPSFLRADLTGEKVQYRDLYVARVAQRYSLGVQGGSADLAFQEAQESLGIASGDASPADALTMVSSAQQAAALENQRDGPNPDAGRFTLADANNMKLLTDRLTQIQGQPVAVPAELQTAQRNALLFGLGLLFLLGLFLVGFLWAIGHLFGARQKGAATATTATSTYTAPVAAADGASATYVRPATVDELPEVLIDVKVPPPATESGLTVPAAGVATMAGAVAFQQRVASPVPGETLIGTYSTTYAHGDDTYDEGFQISSSTGDLIGECGASIVDRYGLERPSRVVALAMWVFDKNDFQSTKSVLMTPFAFRDEMIREKLSSRGELVQARQSLFEVLTSSLRVEVEVRNLSMQPIGNDPDGYFEHVDLEFRVFKRPL
jgi:hypothetical protein